MGKGDGGEVEFRMGLKDLFFLLRYSKARLEQVTILVNNNGLRE